jgi:hypothetical protein
MDWLQNDRNINEYVVYDQRLLRQLDTDLSCQYPAGFFCSAKRNAFVEHA